MTVTGLLLIAASAGMRATNGTTSISACPASLCGPKALYTCASLSGISVSITDLAGRCKTAKDGSTAIDDLERAAREIGFDQATLVKTSPRELKNAKGLSIIFDKKNSHFLVALGTVNGKVLVQDPNAFEERFSGLRAVDDAWFSDWDGYAIQLGRTARGWQRADVLRVCVPGLAGLALGAAGAWRLPKRKRHAAEWLPQASGVVTPPGRARP